MNLLGWEYYYMYSQVSYVLPPPLLDCRERERERERKLYGESNAHGFEKLVIAKWWGVWFVVCAFLFWVWLFCQVDDNWIQDLLNWIFYYLPITKKWNPIVEKDDDDAKSSIILHVIYDDKESSTGAQQSTVMQIRQQHHFDALIFSFGHAFCFVCPLAKLSKFNNFFELFIFF